MYILNNTKAVKVMPVNECNCFIFKKYYKRSGFPKKNIYYSLKRLKKKDLLLLANKLVEKIPDPSNAKEHYKSLYIYIYIYKITPIVQWVLHQ